MGHGWHHEESIEAINPPAPAQRFDHVLVVVNAFARWHVRVAEAMVVNEFATVPLERAQVGISSIQCRGQLLYPSSVGLKIESTEIPIGIGVHEVFEER